MLARSSYRYESYRDRGIRGRRLRRALVLLIGLFILYMLVTTVFLKSVREDSIAMEPTLGPGNRVLASPILYGPRVDAFGWVLPGFSRPGRGDMVLVRPAYLQESRGIRRLVNPLLRFVTLEMVRSDDGGGWKSANQIKRIVGLPGDTVRVERFVAYVRPAGETRFVSEFELSSREYEITAPALPQGWAGDDPLGDAMGELTLGPDEYFVLGDNRERAIDSRHWGVLSERALKAKVIFRYWPPGRMGAL
jgi:signal peptidase I